MGPLVGVGDVKVGRTELALEGWLLVVQAAHAFVITPHVRARSIKITISEMAMGRFDLPRRERMMDVRVMSPTTLFFLPSTTHTLRVENEGERHTCK